ncbi:MAG: DUF835 domain-containing protein [Methanomassiliicoccus sp.]|nr:DUF835 domain-containing protein [Methanomassiliicoccus sp.]
MSIQTANFSVGEHDFLFDYGRVYLVCEKRMDKTLRILQDFDYSGATTLCVTRLHPDLLQERMPGKCVESAWLSERVGTANIHPNQLHRIAQRIGTFLIGKRNAVVLLDGIEYLCLFNDFVKVQMFVEQVNDLIMASKAIMLIPLDPVSLDQRSLARLRRYAEVVGSPYHS